MRSFGSKRLRAMGPRRGRSFSANGIDPVALSSCVWDFRMDTAVYTDTGGTTPASIGSALKFWGNRKTGVSVTKMTEAVTNSMTLTAAGADNNGSGRLEADAVVTLSGVFTAYVLATWAGSSSLHWCGENGGGGGIFFYLNNIYVVRGGGTYQDAVLGVGGDTGRRLFRVRRDAGGVCYYKATGVAESIMGTRAEDVVVSQMFGRKGVDLSSDNNAIERNCLFTADLVADGTAGAVEQNIAGAPL